MISDLILEDFLQACIVAAENASMAILKVVNDERSITAVDKADGSPVTRADLAAHQVLCQALAALEPSYPIVSEEDAKRIPADAEMETYWLVDPLDGTKEFIRGSDEYTVNIALVHQGTPVLGVIELPAARILYYAMLGRGAWKCDAEGVSSNLPRVENRGERVAVVSRSHPSAATNAFLDEHGIRQVMGRGSSLKICAVAEGVADVYPRLGPTWFWDSAAGAAIAAAAGCAVTDPTGAPLSYNYGTNLKHSGFIVYNPNRIHLFK